MFKIILEDIKKILNKNYSFFKKKEILILGATGIVGQYFLAFFFELLRGNDAPKSVTFVYKNKIPQYLNFLKKNKKFILIKDNLANIKINRYKNYDCIIYSTGYAQPSMFLKNSLETIKINTSSLNEFILKLKKNGKFLYVSSSEVYNKNKKKKLNENDIGKTNTNDPRACYIESKRCGEAIANIYNEKFNKDIKIARLSLTYGPGAKKNDGRALFQFIQRSILKKKISINDTGSAIRRYIYILDAVDIMLQIMLHGKSITYNVAGNEKITIRQLAEKIGKITKCQVTIKKKKSLAGSPEDISLSMERYKNEFKKFKFIKMEEGLKKTINWHKKLNL